MVDFVVFVVVDVVAVVVVAVVVNVVVCLPMQKTDAKFRSLIIFDAAEFHFTWKRKKMKEI